MIELIGKRTRNSKTHSLGGRKFSWDGTIGSIHYEDNGWQEIDNIFEPALAPWDWQMLKAGYHIRVKEDFTAGQIIEFEKQGETVQLQPMALEWTNDLDQIQQVSMPQDVAPIITNPEVDLLPGMSSHQGTIRWNNAYGQGIDFQWKCTSSRLTKILEIESLNKLPLPQQYILDGGNPVLRLNLIFDPPNKQNVDIIVDGQVWNQSSKAQTFTRIGFWKDGEELWSFLPLKYWGSGTDLETNEKQSVATLEKRGNKLYISIRVPYGWLQSAVYPMFIDTDISPQPAQVGASTDDCYRRLTTDVWDLVNQNQRVGAASTSLYQYGGGMRFLNITIPQGDTIDVAYLTLRARGSRSGAACNSRISAEDVDDAITFADDSAAFDTRWAARTTARVDWDGIEAWTGDVDYNSPEIKTVIKEIVDRGSWVSGQDIVIFWDDFEDRSTHASNNFRSGYSYNGSTTYAPKLHIEYSAAVAGWANKFIGVANAAIGTVTGTAKASVKQVNGVA